MCVWRLKVNSTVFLSYSPPCLSDIVPLIESGACFGWPTSLRDLPVSSSLALELYVLVLSIFNNRGSGRPNWNLHESTFLMESSPQTF